MFPKWLFSTLSLFGNTTQIVTFERRYRLLKIIKHTTKGSTIITYIYIYLLILYTVHFVTTNSSNKNPNKQRIVRLSSPKSQVAAHGVAVTLIRRTLLYGCTQCYGRSRGSHHHYYDNKNILWLLNTPDGSFYYLQKKYHKHMGLYGIQKTSPFRQSPVETISIPKDKQVTYFTIFTIDLVVSSLKQ